MRPTVTTRHSESWFVFVRRFHTGQSLIGCAQRGAGGFVSHRPRWSRSRAKAGRSVVMPVDTDLEAAECRPPCDGPRARPVPGCEQWRQKTLVNNWMGPWYMGTWAAMTPWRGPGTCHQAGFVALLRHHERTTASVLSDGTARAGSRGHVAHGAGRGSEKEATRTEASGTVTRRRRPKAAPRRPGSSRRC